MKKGYQEKGILARGKDVYVGIDVHKDNWHVTIRGEGEEILNVNMSSNYHALKKLLGRFQDCRIRVSYEAGPCGFWLYDRLTADGIDTIVAPPSLIPTESGNRVKTDKRDSRKLAWLLESNMLKRIYVLTEEERAHRELVRTRRQLVEHQCDVARQIKSKLLFYGVKSAFSGRSKWTKSYLTWLKGSIFKEEILNKSVKRLLELYEYLGEQIKEISKEAIALSRSEKYLSRVNLLRSVPGIGILSAMEILVELQDVERFNSARQIASYIGLTPSEYSTGQHIRQGGITRCGNKRVRTILVESSWILIGKDPYMQMKYRRLKNAKGGKRAIIAIARNLIIRLRKMLLTNEPYRIGGARAAA
jgi:transposase